MNNSESSYIVTKDLNAERLWKTSSPLLPYLDMELTERCNNRCVHCYINQAKNDPEIREKEMNTARVKGILDQAASLGCLTVRFTGGEPLLRQDISDIYLYARRLGIKVRLSTNAAEVTPELGRLLKRYPPGEPVEITLYGMSPSVYESVSRVRGGFEAAMNGVRLLQENNVPIVIKGVRLPETSEEFPRFERFAKEISAGGKSGSVAMNFNLRARRDSKEKNRLIQKLRATPKETLSFLTRNREAYIKEKKLFAAKFMRPGGEKLFNCGCGKGGAVDAYGNFQPCLLLRAPELVYDLKNGSLEDALVNVFPEMRKKKAANSSYLRRCARCFLQGLCEQCPAHSWMETGTLDAPVEYFCRVAHEQARFLGLIIAGENAWEVEDWKNRIRNFVKDSYEPYREDHAGQY